MIWWRTLPYVGVVVALLASYGWVYYNGLKNARDECRKEINELRLAAAQAARDAEMMLRQQERQYVEKLAALDVKYHTEMQNEVDKRNKIIHDLRTGTLRVRKQLTCPEPTSGGVPQVTISPSVGDAAERGGLQTEDVEFLLREAARADEIVVQLQACQDILRMK